MLFPLTPENLTFLPLISPVASCSKISPHLLHIDSPGGGTLVDSYTHWHDPPAGYPGQSPPHPWTGQQLPYKSAQSNPPPLPWNLPGWLQSLSSVLLLGAGSQPAAPDWCTHQSRLLLNAVFSTWLSAQRTLILNPVWGGSHSIPGPVPPHLHLQEGRWRMEKCRRPWKPQNPRASDGTAFWNPWGEVHQASHPLTRDPPSNPERGSSSPTCRKDTEASEEEGVPGCHGQGASLGTTLHLATSRDRLSSERPERLHHILLSFLLKQVCVCSHQNMPTQSPSTGVPQPLRMASASSEVLPWLPLMPQQRCANPILDMCLSVWGGITI